VSDEQRAMQKKYINVRQSSKKTNFGSLTKSILCNHCIFYQDGTENNTVYILIKHLTKEQEKQSQVLNSQLWGKTILGLMVEATQT